ncbi:MAG: hypothetical protein H0W84_13985, partial [Bacteroidetes bacterium]|nr:hypothetical protein [Bacteroidota bacterium]
MQFSVVLYDASNNALNWSYSPCVASTIKGGYIYYTSKFMIPGQVASIQPRLMGMNKCNVYVDDVSLTKRPITTTSGTYSIENALIKAEIKIPEITLKVTNKKSLKVYQTQSSTIMAVTNVNQPNPQSLVLTGKYINSAEDNFEIDLTAIGKSIKMEMKGDSSIVWNDNSQFPGDVYNQTGEYMIIPKATGIIIPVNKTYPYYQFNTSGWSSTLPFVGVTNMNDGYMVATDDQWDVRYEFEKPQSQNQYIFKLYNLSAKKVMSYNRTSYMVVVDSGYVEMCSWYRKHAESLGYTKTFTQKKLENPNVDKLIGAVDFWDLYTGLSSNPKTLDTLKWMGMDKAIFSLEGGWGVGNNGVVIDTINAKGFLSSRYDIYTDVYPSPTPTGCSGYRTAGYPQDVVVQEDVSMQKGWLSYCNNQPYQGYYLCSKTHLPYCQSTIMNDLSINKYNCRFIDVELASNLEECFSTTHPVTRKQDAYHRSQLLKYIKENKMMVLGGEQAHDFAFPYVDFGEGTMSIESDANAGYDWQTPVIAPTQSYLDNNIKTTLRVPLHGLTYHDVHVPTWYTGDGASKVPAGWDDKNLWNILYSSMPLYMPPSKQYWYSNFNKFICGYNLMTAVIRATGYNKMIYHQFITSDWNIQQTQFDNGWKVTVNFNSTPYTYNSKVLAPKGFYASGNNNEEVYKVLEGTDTVSYAQVSDRIFLQTYGVLKTKTGTRLTGTVFIKNYGN